MESKGLAYTGEIKELNPIDGDDSILSAVVDCGDGGVWRGIIRSGEFKVGDVCMAYLPDAILEPWESYMWMESYERRVRINRFRGAVSEVLLMPCGPYLKPGMDCTAELGVKKYIKPVPEILRCGFIGPRPKFIPMLRQQNYQAVPVLVDLLHREPYYVTEKRGGYQVAAYRFKGKFGLCNEEFELERNDYNGFWIVARRYKLEQNIPEGYALQWETCGPYANFAFSVFDIYGKKYMKLDDFLEFISKIGMPVFVEEGNMFNPTKIESLSGFRCINSGKPLEGVVVRSIDLYETQDEVQAPINFKVLNPDYEE